VKPTANQGCLEEFHAGGDEVALAFEDVRDRSVAEALVRHLEDASHDQRGVGIGLEGRSRMRATAFCRCGCGTSVSATR
jgi:hypothetical protein